MSSYANIVGSSIVCSASASASVLHSFMEYLEQYRYDIRCVHDIGYYIGYNIKYFIGILYPRYIHAHPCIYMVKKLMSNAIYLHIPYIYPCTYMYIHVKKPMSNAIVCKVYTCMHIVYTWKVCKCMFIHFKVYPYLSILICHVVI